MKSLLTTILSVLFFVSGALAQTTDYVLTDKSTMTIAGTSTIHDWEADVEKMEASIGLNASALQAETKENPVTSFTLSVPVESIESGKGGMNKKIYKALKEEDHPQIRFELTGAELTSNAQATNGNEGDFQLMATGKITIAGVTNEVSFPVTAFTPNSNTYQFTGSYEINMKDYNV
ncbi:MAG: YceI family protein [Fodinibius sp.]|nr:YceI family protein [Fodinibius sp.]